MTKPRKLTYDKVAIKLKYIRKIDISGLHPKLNNVRFQLMSDFDSKIYGKNSEIMQTYEAYGITRSNAAEIDNLIWYFSEMFKSELRLVLGPVQRGGAGGGIAAVLNALYHAEIMTSHELVSQNHTFRCID